MQNIAHNDMRLSFEGAVSIEHSRKWSQPWRIPFEDRDLYFERLAARAAMPSGIRLVFRSNTTRVAGSITPMPEMPPMDLYIDGVLFQTAPMANQREFQFGALPEGDKLLELWLPQWEPFQLRGLKIDEGAELHKVQNTFPRWVTYGSSITHCRKAQSPSLTWPAIVARKSGLHLTSLGFAGECQADPMMARLIRDLPAQFISVSIGINIYGSTSMSARAFGAAVTGTVKTIRDGHAAIPLVMISPILSPPRESVPNAAGITLIMMREIMESSIDALKSHGDLNLHYVNGLDIFGPELAEFMPDNCHPSAEGYKIIAEKFMTLVVKKYFKNKN